jgi:hypothetical protein
MSEKNILIIGISTLSNIGSYYRYLKLVVIRLTIPIIDYRIALRSICSTRVSGNPEKTTNGGERSYNLHRMRSGSTREYRMRARDNIFVNLPVHSHSLCQSRLCIRGRCRLLSLLLLPPRVLGRLCQGCRMSKYKHQVQPNFYVVLRQSSGVRVNKEKNRK